MTAAIDRPLRLRALWLAWLLCMLFHVDLGLMPLFPWTLAGDRKPSGPGTAAAAVHRDDALFPGARGRCGAVGLQRQ
jgi:hypothetical protein